MQHDDPRPGIATLLGRLLCRIVVWSFGLIYVLVLAVKGISDLGWFGAPAPLSGVFLVVLGLPWTLAAAWFDDAAQPLVAALAPGVTLLILATFCRLRR
jgi:hypothetical protein